MKLNEILIEAKEKLTKDRYDHTLRVIETSEKLAVIHKVDIEKVTLASAMHDYSKCESKDYLENYIIDHKLDKDLLNYHYELWHSHVGADIAFSKFDIKDKSILNAIKYHTTGRAKMDNVELIVFISDFIEPNRKMPGVNKIREIANEDLAEAALLIFKTSIPYLIGLNAIVYPGTIEAYNDLIKLKGEF